MQFEQVFTSAIEAGIAIAGFSGIVAVVGDRSVRRLSPSDVGRVVLLLQGSLAATLLAFLALLLGGAGVPEPTIWRVGSACFAAYVALAMPLHFRRFRSMRDDPAFAPVLVRLVAVGVVLVGALQLVNAVFLHAGWPFALAVVFELSMALLNFVRLLRRVWEEASP